VTAIPLGEGRAFRVGPMDVAVFRLRTGEVLATQATCPHRSGPLADGIVGSGRVICPLHGYSFDLASGRPGAAATDAIEVYTVLISEQGEILLSLGDDP
jgi:nitrite reductase (NADH) small subunit